MDIVENKIIFIAGLVSLIFIYLSINKSFQRHNLMTALSLVCVSLLMFSYSLYVLAAVHFLFMAVLCPWVMSRVAKLTFPDEQSIQRFKVLNYSSLNGNWRSYLLALSSVFFLASVLYIKVIKPMIFAQVNLNFITLVMLACLHLVFGLFQILARKNQLYQPMAVLSLNNSVVVLLLAYHFYMQPLARLDHLIFGVIAITTLMFGVRLLSFLSYFQLKKTIHIEETKELIN